MTIAKIEMEYLIDTDLNSDGSITVKITETDKESLRVKTAFLPSDDDFIVYIFMMMANKIKQMLPITRVLTDFTKRKTDD